MQTYMIYTYIFRNFHWPILTGWPAAFGPLVVVRTPLLYNLRSLLSTSFSEYLVAKIKSILCKDEFEDKRFVFIGAIECRYYTVVLLI